MSLLTPLASLIYVIMAKEGITPDQITGWEKRGTICIVDVKNIGEAKAMGSYAINLETKKVMTKVL